MSEKAFCHFAKRVHERIGRGVDARALWVGVIAALENMRTDLFEPLGRLNKNGRRAFRMREATTGQTFIVMVDTDSMTPVTVFSEDMTIYGLAAKL